MSKMPRAKCVCVYAIIIRHSCCKLRALHTDPARVSALRTSSLAVRIREMKISYSPLGLTCSIFIVRSSLNSGHARISARIIVMHKNFVSVSFSISENVSFKNYILLFQLFQMRRKYARLFRN